MSSRTVAMAVAWTVAMATLPFFGCKDGGQSAGEDSSAPPADVQALDEIPLAEAVEGSLPLPDETSDEASPHPGFESCDEAVDCPHGFCTIALGSHGYCMTPCTDPCPEGTWCQELPVFGAPHAGVCAPPWFQLCHPCASNAGCGGPQDHCVVVGDEGTFCGMDCGAGIGCPEGYSCEQSPSADGVGQSWQCVPAGKTCCMVGLAGNVAPCHRTNDWGSCSGTMVCLGGGMGWTQCTAKMPDAESCNDLDDDCNGLTDDGFADSDGDGDADCIDVDTDNDGVPDETDNCIFLNNPEQADYDQDLNGDECDGDDDNDWWPDYYDCEPLDKTSFPGAEEVQDGKDNNCNDQIDETDQTGGNCGLGCFQEGAGPGQGQAFDLDKEGVSGLETDDKGYLKLGVGSLKFPSIWISNSGEGTVSKLDTETGKEEGRYKVCSDPSRTAVDLLGDVWVACRGDGGVAKIILFDANCTDKDGDGTVETSTDNNGDGKIQGAEMLPQGQDECIKFIAYPGGSCQRAAGVDKENFAWIGEWNESKLRRLHPDNGAVVQTVELQGVNPYGLVIDGDGIVWISGRGGNKLLRVDPLTNQVKQYAPPNAGWGFEPYGISLDAKGRIWIASCCMEAKVYRFDPAVEQFSEVTTQSSPRGVVGHLNGNVYVANDSSDNVAVIVADTLQVAANVDLGYGRFPVGMSVDIDGNVWAVNQNGNSATKIDVLTNQVIGEYPVGLYPYTYSDMTGYLLYTYTSPSGYYYETFCANTESPVQWVLLNADLAWPEGTLAAVRLRSAASAELLQEKAWLSPFDKFPPETFPKELGAVAGLDDKCLEVEFLLSPNEDGASPLLKKIVVQYQVEL